jgi:phage head maturation protease
VPHLIEGVALPYGVPSRPGRRRRVRFAHGALHVDPDAVRLIVEHNQALRVGRLAWFDDWHDGLRVGFGVGRGRAAEQGLRLAAYRRLPGLSVGVDYELDDAADDPWFPGVLLIYRAVLLTVSLTTSPAFSGARVCWTSLDHAGQSWHVHRGRSAGAMSQGGGTVAATGGDLR